MAEVKVEIDLECKCGNGLDVKVDKWGTGLIITPCEKCLREARDEGYHEGYTEAEEELKE